MSRTVVFAANSSWYLFHFRQSTIQALRDRAWNVKCLASTDNLSDLLIADFGVDHIPFPLVGKETEVVSELLSFLFIARALRHYMPVFVFNFTIKLNVH